MNRRFIKISANEQKIANLIFDQQLITTVSSVIRLYWDLVSLRGDVGVKQQALTTAQKLYEDNQQQVEVGTLAPFQLKRAAAEVARAKQDLINSQSLVEQQEVILKNVLTRTGTADASLANVHIITLDRIDIPAEDQVPPMSELADQAIRNRPDLMQAQIEIQNAGLSLKGSRNEFLPQLNIVAGVTNNALAGNINPDAQVLSACRLLPTLFLLEAEELFCTNSRRNYPDYGIGFQLNIPLGIAWPVRMWHVIN